MKMAQTVETVRESYISSKNECRIFDTLIHTKSSKGITLISLVVTIIVLLILAGVSIHMVLGDNGILEKAKETQKVQALAEEKERLENARLATKIDGINVVTVDSYIKELKDEEMTTDDKVTDNGDGTKTLITKNGYTVKVSPTENGKDVIIEIDGETLVKTELITQISLNKTSKTITEGATLSLIATISPENATNKEIEWTSSNESVATVDANGLVTAVVEGSAVITATAKDGSNVKTECNVTVTINPANYTWTQSKTIVTGTHKTISGKTVTLEVGSAYTYNSEVSGGYTGNWGILGAGASGTSEAGKLLIMTTSNVVDSLGLKGKTGDGTDDYPAGYNNGIAKLNEVCEEKCGTGARSINVDDVNRVTGYDPENQGDGTVYGAGNWYEYGNKVTYTASKTTSTKYTTPYTGGLYNSVYYHPDGRRIGGTGGTQVSAITETSTYYNYYPHSLTTDKAITGTCKGISTSSKAYEMIFGTYANTSAKKGNEYWLASSCVYTYSYDSYFRMRYVYPYGCVNGYGMRNSYSTTLYGTSMAVRAVVSL